MKLGILTGVLGALERKAAFARAKRLGFDAVELGTGEFTTDVHAGLERLGQDSAAVAELQTDLADAGLELSALSCHGNTLHPQKPYATRADDILRRTIAAASALGVENVVCFSACPGEPGGQYPNWITTPWPGYFDDLLEWQWAEQLIPYSDRRCRYAADKGVRIAIEMHPGMSVYNLPTLSGCEMPAVLRSGRTTTPAISGGRGWTRLSRPARDRAGRSPFPRPRQGHVHRSPRRRPCRGLENASHTAVERAWRFTTLGYGHDLGFWREFVGELRSVGFDGVLSVEHEDPLAPIDEALERSVEILRSSIWREPSAETAWLVDDDPPYTATTAGSTPVS